MMSFQLRESTGLSQAELTCWINQGLLIPERTGGGGRNPEFDAAQLPRIHVLRALHEKGVRLSQLVRLPLDLNGQFVIIDSKGESLRTCRDAEAAIRAVVAGKRWCCAVEIRRLSGAQPFALSR